MYEYKAKDTYFGAWVQNASNKTHNVTKRPILQNAHCNKTHNYKTSNVTKRPMLQNVQCMCPSCSVGPLAYPSLRAWPPSLSKPQLSDP